MAYSPFFQTLHDETAPVGDLGRGTHYSVLRAVMWHDAGLRLLPRAVFLDIAVVWDEDHDQRVIGAVESLYYNGLLGSVRFVGERKGVLTVLVDSAADLTRDETAFAAYKKRVEDVAGTPGDNDSWTVVVDTVGGRNHTIINDDRRKVDLYLGTVNMLWSLGNKPAAVARAAS